MSSNSNNLKKIIIEEYTKIVNQSESNLTHSSSDKELKTRNAITKLAARFNMRVYMSFRSSYNTLELITKDDVEESVFEKFITLLEKLGYNVDIGQSVRYYDYEPGERHFYPRIRFK